MYVRGPVIPNVGRRGAIKLKWKVLSGSLIKMAELLFVIAVLSLGLAWFFWVVGWKHRTVAVWRRLLSLVALIAVGASAIELLRCRVAVQHSDFMQRLDIVPHCASTGLLLTAAALLVCWFSPRKTLLCLLPSTVIIGFLWWGALVAL